MFKKNPVIKFLSCFSFTPPLSKANDETRFNWKNWTFFILKISSASISSNSASCSCICTPSTMVANGFSQTDHEKHENETEHETTWEKSQWKWCEKDNYRYLKKLIYMYIYICISSLRLMCFSKKKVFFHRRG